MNSAYSYPVYQKSAATEPKPERQCWGQTLSVILIFISIWVVFFLATKPFFNQFAVEYSINILANISFIVFQLLALFKSDYLKGKPSFLKLAPLLALPMLYFISDIITCIKYPNKAGVVIVISLIINGIRFISYYSMYSFDDDSGSCCLCSKPWIYKRPHSPYGQYPFMPPHAYVPQGYLAAYGYQAQGYPQQGAYVIQAQAQKMAYPQQGYPTQGQVPQQGAYPTQFQVPQQGYPAQAQTPQQGANVTEKAPYPQQTYTPPQVQAPQQGFAPQQAASVTPQILPEKQNPLSFV